MGQYYEIINVDKKQYFYPHDWDNGMKLMEFSYIGNNMVHKLIRLLQNEWHGDHVYVVGDYASDAAKADPAPVWLDAYRNGMCQLHIDLTNDPTDLQSYADNHFTKIMPSEKDKQVPESLDEMGYRFIYNHGTQEYIDLAACPIEWPWYDKDTGEAGVTKVCPLTLLLAMGNGEGGGDYYGKNGKDLVGSWCKTVTQIEITDGILIGKNYTELRPNFTQNDHLIPWEKEAEVIEEAIRKAKNR